MHDLVIRGGTVVDGTGRPRFEADIAIDNGTITAVGPGPGPGAREIDARGLIVTPGFVDIHTHYDGQVSWDSVIAPSSWHGVTSVVMGNCGVGFAPASPDKHDFLISLMEGVEDIPGAALAEGLTWDWVSLPEYLDAIAARRYTVDIGAQVPHAPLRAFVMGERGADHTQDPTPDEIAEMARLTYEGLQAGALGFASSRTVNHRTKAGQKIGTLTARSEELLGIAGALREAGHGVLEFANDFRDAEAELTLFRRLAEESGRPLSFGFTQKVNDPDGWREILKYLEAAAAEGVDMKGQTTGRPVGILLGIQGSMNPFMLTDTFKAFEHLPFEERLARFRDPEMRRRMIAEHGTHRGAALAGTVPGHADRLFALGDPPNYEPDPSDSIGEQARRAGTDPIEHLYDALLADGGRAMLYYPGSQYAQFSLDAARELILSDRTLFGLSDGGAHVGLICDASFPTYNITHWCRDRVRGEQLPLEFVVKGQTRDTAAHVGWHDRGVLAPGYRADVNVIDFAKLALRPPRMVHDLPAGGRRLLQEAIGYRYTIKAGQVTFADGKHTGALPGTLVRGPQPAPA